MFDLDLLAAGFSAILGVEVVPPEKGPHLPKLSIHNLFHLTYIPIPLESVDPGQLFDIYVKTLTGARITIQVTNAFTIANVKAAIEQKEDIPARDQKLVFSSQTLKDEDTIESAGIPHGGTLFLIVLVRGDGPAFQMDLSELDKGYDYDFTNVSDDGKRYMRSKFEYRRPYGWYRYALRVLSKYDSDEWLGPGGIRTASSAQEWPVSYHGTNMKNTKSIAKEGFKIGPRELHGKGVYTSPSMEMIASHGYAQTFQHDGATYLIALQNRVNPDTANGHLVIIPPSKTGAGAEYWISPKQSPEDKVFDVRPYGVVVRKY